MTKIDIFSGFLGAGKTTLIKKLIAEAYAGEKLVLIENEFGEISVDGGFMQDTGIRVNELISGCICCSLAGDFTRALQQVLEEYRPDRILIEPSGVGMLSDILSALTGIEGTEINCAVAVADANRCKIYTQVLGDFFTDQVTHAGAVVLSRTQKVSAEKLQESVEVLRALNPDVAIITTPWDALDGKQILAAIEHTDTLAKEIEALRADADDDDDDEECDDPDCACHHHHDDDEAHEHHHHHHHHDEEECDDPDCECHHHHDEDECDDPDCECHHHHDDAEHEHHHHHHHHHAADEVFTSWGTETAKKFTEQELRDILTALDDTGKYGTVLRSKGIVDSSDGDWLHFDYVPGEFEIRRGSPMVTGRLVVIGSKLQEAAVQELFGI